MMLKMRTSYFVVFLVFLAESSGIRHTMRSDNPPHCTQLVKDTDYMSKFKYEYPMVYIPPSQVEAYQTLYCTNPPQVNKAQTIVCDWAAPPQVQFTIGDTHVHIVRQDPDGKFLGNAVIATYQLCTHNQTSVEMDNANINVKLHN